MNDEEIKKILETNKQGQAALLGCRNWQELQGKCNYCEQETLEYSRGISLRTYGGLVHCKSCNRTESPTNYFAKAAFPIQKMPDGALPFYLNELSKEENGSDNE